ncbi:hypothetical protein [Umezawaea tangerina]|uniref:Uncharacterized protein n=1 Tax=Umezawaea tangerina TaxID=84725 RepID=A0A2T0SPP1_9PSEU|nr:hypothetical protein [Umezawaea tangerina]PRY35375.1 hypothetical protein CLV43_114293 [Umezawaea tangerina]
MPASDEVQTQVAERRARAVQLRIAGASLDEIASALQYGGSTPESRRAAVSKDLSRAFEAAKDDERASSEMWRQLELARLDRLQRGLWPRAVTGDTQSVRALLTLMDRRAKYLGLDAPEKADNSSDVRYTVVGVDPEAMK